MKTIVIYLSVTGNTEKIAKAIQAGVKKAAGHCDIVKMRDANPRRLYEYDLIGLGSFVLDAEPSNVTEFIKNMWSVGGKHVFVFSTHGASPGKFFPSVHPQLTAKGLIVIGMRDWYGTVNIYHCPKPYPTDGHPDEIDLKETEDFGREMVEHSRRISAGETGLIPPVPQQPVWTKLPGMSEAKEPVPPEFPYPLQTTMRWHNEKCPYPKCRLCMDNCPVYGIDITLNPPILANPCIECELCIKICPTGALEADAYSHWAPPETAMAVDVRSFFLPFLEKEEAAGHFRRLVAIRNIGWDTPIAKQIGNKHPHWIIGKGFTVSPKDIPKADKSKK